MSNELNKFPERLEEVSRELRMFFNAIQARTRAELTGDSTGKPTKKLAALLHGVIDEIRYQRQRREVGEFSSARMNQQEITRLNHLLQIYEVLIGGKTLISDFDTNISAVHDGTQVAWKALSEVDPQYRLAGFEDKTTFLSLEFRLNGKMIQVLFPESYRSQAHHDLAFIHSLLERKIKRFISHSGTNHSDDPEDGRNITIILIPPEAVDNQEIDAIQIDHLQSVDNLAILLLPVSNRAVYSHELEHVTQVLLNGKTSHSDTLNEGWAAYYGDCDELSFEHIHVNFRTKVVRIGAALLRKELGKNQVDRLGLSANSLRDADNIDNERVRHFFGYMFVDCYLQLFGEEKFWMLYELSTRNPNHLNEEQLLIQILSDHPSLLQTSEIHMTIDQFKLIFEQFVRKSLRL